MTSVADCHFAIDNSLILHHLEDRFPSALQWRGRLPSPSPDLPGCQPLAGQLVVFTGKLSSLGRRDARALVARLGGATSDDVNARTTMLVVGAEGFGPALPQTEAGSAPPEGDSAASPTREKSHKLKRADELNAQQAPQIRIVAEEEFCRLAHPKENCQRLFR